MNGLGLAFIPFTFPTAMVAREMERLLPGQRVAWTVVDRIWSIYKIGVEDEIIPSWPVSKTEKKTYLPINYLYSKGIDKTTAQAFLRATETVSELAGAGYIDPLQEKIATGKNVEKVKSAVRTVSQTVGGGIGDLTKPLTDNLKFIAIAASVIGIGYIGYKSGAFKKMSSSFNRKRAK